MLNFGKHPNFSGHETFPFRYGWLKKGVDSVIEDCSIFNRDDSMVILGVGKNMVLSIKHWCTTAKLISKDTEDRNWIVTDIGKCIFGPNGYDPYLEDPKTLWLLHWLISSNYSKATTWFYTFSYWSQPEFNKDLLVKTIIGKIREAGFNHISETTIKRDIECFVRTYVPSKAHPNAFLEDSFDCPLIELDLISDAGNKTFYFHRGDHLSLPNTLFSYMVIDFWTNYYPERKSLTFEEIAYRPGSPGRLLRLDENSISKRLELIEKLTQGALVYDETAGLKQLYKRTEIDPIEFLGICYC